VGIVTGQIKRR